MQMSDLTLSLIAVGVLILAGMIAHSAWQARKANPRRADPPPPRPAPQEPLMGEAPAPRDPPALSSQDIGALGGMPGDAPSAAAQDPGVPRPARYVLRIDALVDAVVPITLEASLSGDALLPHLPATRRAGSKPFLIEGFNPASGEWEHPVAGARYSELQAGLQLANRSGALNEIEYSEFVQKIEAFAQSVGGMADFPDMLEIVARARELDGFASQHDAQLAVHLRARATAWSVGFVQQHAARHGFVSVLLSGRMVLPAQEEGAPPILTLQFDPQAALAEDPNLAALRTVTLSFDVPQTDAGVKPFDLWQERARALAMSMEAFVVDDNGQTLSPEGFTAIGKELEWLYQALDKRELPAGSLAARRLFS
jgi:hypothetical protein